jgi:hypothetical protein
MAAKRKPPATIELDEALAEGFDAFMVDPERHRVAWGRANTQWKRAQDGQRRNAGRGSGPPANSNAPVIGFIVRELFPDLLTVRRLRGGVIKLIQDRLRKMPRGKLPPQLRRWCDPDTHSALARAIRRARASQRIHNVPPPPE